MTYQKIPNNILLNIPALGEKRTTKPYLMVAGD